MKAFARNGQEIKIGHKYMFAEISLSKPVKQLSRDGVLIREFYGIHEAGRETNIDYRNIYCVLAGQRKTAGGYKWEYAL